jgi:hypothetical protein
VSQVNAGTGAPPNGAAAPPPGGARRPIGAVVSSIVDGARTLVRKEIELAKIEATEAVAVRAKGAGLMGSAGVFGLFAVGFAGVAGAAALNLVLPRWAAYLIVAAVFGIFAAIMVAVGRRAIKTAPKPERTQETLKEDARWAKRQLAR